MLGTVIVGQKTVIEQMVVTLLSRGHALVEGVPGTAKTMLVKGLAICLGHEFKRIQLTPDLMPSDIIGTYVFDMQSTTFNLRKGPVFTDFLLADEINRAPAKTQSALLEAMQERQVTIEGSTHELADDFTLFATQNPIEYEGTYPLPEAQLDRFTLKIVIDYPAEAEEIEMLRLHAGGFDDSDLREAGLQTVIEPGQLRQCRAEILDVRVTDDMLEYIAAITRSSRTHGSLVLGCSPRASAQLLKVSKTIAAMRGRDFVIPDDVQDIARPALRHRLLLRPEAEIDGLKPDDIITQIISGIPVPRTEGAT
ncbi:MAG: AAA family ATPase [Armatimonadota bacterium]